MTLPSKNPAIVWFPGVMAREAMTVTTIIPRPPVYFAWLIIIALTAEAKSIGAYNASYIIVGLLRRVIPQ